MEGEGKGDGHSGVQRLLDARGQRGSWMPSKMFCIPVQWRRPSLEGRKKFFGPKFLNDVFFRKNFHFHAHKILMTFFSHRPGFFSFLLSLFSNSPYLYCVKCLISPFLPRKSNF